MAIINSSEAFGTIGSSDYIKYYVSRIPIIISTIKASVETQRLLKYNSKCTCMYRNATSGISVDS